MPAVDGTKIRETRRRLGLKLGEFAEASRIPYQTLANIESCDQPTSFERLAVIAVALGVQPEDLLKAAA